MQLWAPGVIAAGSRTVEPVPSWCQIPAVVSSNQWRCGLGRASKTLVCVGSIAFNVKQYVGLMDVRLRQHPRRAGGNRGLGAQPNGVGADAAGSRMPGRTVRGV